MRRLLLAGVLALIPAVPADAAGACATTRGFPVCAGTCAPGDTITVMVIGNGSGHASCGGVTASCGALRGACSDTATATTSGVLSCAGGGAVVVCSAGPGAR